MMKKITTLLLILPFAVLSQVGINTTTPSDASVLEIQSSGDGVKFGGFLPPRVTLAQRGSIPVTAADEGLIVFLSDGSTRCLQIYNGTENSWENMHCLELAPDSTPDPTVIAAWEVNGVTGFGSSPFDATSSDPGVTIVGLTRGTGLTTSGTPAANAWGANGWDTTNQADAIAANNFATFSITPNVDTNVSFTSIAPYNIRRSGTGPTTGIWQYSINGTDFFDIGSAITWGTTTSGAGNNQIAIDLSGIGDLQNVVSTTTVTFRIVNWNASNAGGVWYINNVTGDDLIVNGIIIN